MNKRKAIILFSAAVLLLSGCGSKGDKETTAASTAATTAATTEAATTAAETTAEAEETVKETESFSGSSKMEFSNNVVVEVDGYNLVEDTERTIVDGEECQKYYEDKDADVSFMIVYSVLADTEIIPQYMEDVNISDYSSHLNEETATGSFLSLSGGDKGTLVLYRSEDAYGTYFIVGSSSSGVNLQTTIHDIANQIEAQDSSIVEMSDFSFDEYMSSGSTESTGSGSSSFLEFPNGLKFAVDEYDFVRDESNAIVDGSDSFITYKDSKTGISVILAFDNEYYIGSEMDSDIIPNLLEMLKVPDFAEIHQEDSALSGCFLFANDDDLGSCASFVSGDEAATYAILLVSAERTDLKPMIHNIADKFLNKLGDSSIYFEYTIPGVESIQSEDSTFERTPYSPIGTKYWDEYPDDWSFGSDRTYWSEYYNSGCSASWYYVPEDYTVDFISGTDSKFKRADDNDTVETFKVTANAGEFTVVSRTIVDEHGTTERHRYYILSDDNTKYVELQALKRNEEISESDIVDMLNAFLHD